MGGVTNSLQQIGMWKNPQVGDKPALWQEEEGKEKGKQ